METETETETTETTETTPPPRQFFVIYIDNVPETETTGDDPWAWWG